MKTSVKLLMAFSVIIAFSLGACNSGSGEKSEKEKSKVEAESGEHTHEAGDTSHSHESTEGGEEDGIQFSKSEVYDEVKKGTHLILKYNAEANAFMGTVENTTDDLIENVRVEVHLSNGLELGPSTPVDLKPAGKVEIKIDAGEKEFETWSTHAEVGNSEHNHEGGEGEHSHGEEGEHTHEGEGAHEHK